jgi:hypothetical protein
MSGEYEFDVRYSQKGKNVLDDIYGEFSPDRTRVRLVPPKREHEIVILVEHDTPEQFSRMLGSLCTWLKENNADFRKLEDLMLY